MHLRTAARFKRDVQFARRRSKDMDKLWAVIGRLVTGQPLQPHNRQHRLSGNWSGTWECHIESDWLLISGNRMTTGLRWCGPAATLISSESADR